MQGGARAAVSTLTAAPLSSARPATAGISNSTWLAGRCCDGTVWYGTVSTTVSVAVMS